LDPKSGELFATSSWIFIGTHLTTPPEEQRRAEESRAENDGVMREAHHRRGKEKGAE
jgi:hypothetical protein